MTRLPQALLEADQAFAALLGRVVTSKYINPTNEVEARAAFEAKKPVRFTYTPATWADEWLRTLDRIRPPEHPLGAVLNEAIVEVRAMAIALRDRTPQAMDKWGAIAGWLESPWVGAGEGAGRYDGAVHQGEPHGGPERTGESRDFPAFAVRAQAESTCTARELSAALEAALREQGLHTWRVESDPVMSARVLVDSLRCVIRVNPRAMCTPIELRALVAHEVGVHVRRSVNGARQRLVIFQHSLPRSLDTEEGLALHAEAEAVGLPPGTVERQAYFAEKVLRGRELGFTDLANEIRRETGANPWLMCLRIKRALANPELPGAYAKDRVYWLGILRVAAYFRAGGEKERLMVGKVGLHHPIEEWVREGWVV